MTTLTSAEFFARVWPARLMKNETLELRVKDQREGKMISEFFSSTPEFINRVHQYQKEGRHDIFFGVATRSSHHSGKKKDCMRVQCVWVDLDKRQISQLDMEPKPSILVESGTGVHAYWILDCPLLVQNEERWKEIEAVNRGLVSRFDGDDGAIDVSRILRVPNTLNHKYNPPRSVRAYLP
jgi:hypothetical protein